MYRSPPPQRLEAPVGYVRFEARPFDDETVGIVDGAESVAATLRLEYLFYMPFALCVLMVQF